MSLGALSPFFMTVLTNSVFPKNGEKSIFHFAMLTLWSFEAVLSLKANVRPFFLSSERAVRTNSRLKYTWFSRKRTDGVLCVTPVGNPIMHNCCGALPHLCRGCQRHFYAHRRVVPFRGYAVTFLDSHTELNLRHCFAACGSYRHCSSIQNNLCVIQCNPSPQGRHILTVFYLIHVTWGYETRTFYLVFIVERLRIF